MAKKPTQLPPLTSMEAIKEALDVRLGRRGDKRDAAVTFRDLEESGSFTFVRRGGGTQLVPRLPGDDDTGVDDTWVPSVPTGFAATSMFGGIFLSWDWPPRFSAISFAEIYRATSNDAGAREFLTTVDGVTYFDAISGDDEQEYFYWIRFRSYHDVVGPFAGPASAVSQRKVKDIIDDVENDITGTDAYKDIMEGVVPFDEQFGSTIERIESRVAAIKSRAEMRMAQIKANVAARKQQVKSALQAKVLDPNSITDAHVDNYMNIAGVNSQAALELANTAQMTAITAGQGLTKIESLDIDEDSALYTRFSSIDTRVGNAEGSIQNIEDLDISPNSALYTKLDSASVSAAAGVAKADSILNLSADPNSVFAEFVEAMSVTKSDGSYARFEETKKLADDLSGEYSIKLDNNGNVAGFGLYNTTGEGSSFAVRADRFYVVNEGSDADSASDENLPFIVEGGRTYIRDASIQEATIDRATVATLSATDARIANATINGAQITNGSITNAKIGNTIQSYDYRHGAVGWSINKSGFAQFNNIDARGNITGSNISGSFISGSVISGTAFVTATDAGNQYLGIVTDFSWGDSGTGYNGSYITPFVDIRSYNYSNLSEYRRFRRLRVPIRVDVSWDAESHYKDHSVRVVVKENNTVKTDTGYVRGDLSDEYSGWSNASWSINISGHSYESCRTDTCAGTYCITSSYITGFVFQTPNYHFSGDGRLRIYVYVRNYQTDIRSFEVSANIYAHNDY